MEQRTEIMVYLGAVVGANCIPCFDHLYEKARTAGLSDEEIREAVAAARKAKNGAAVFFDRAVSEAVGEIPDDGEPCCAVAAKTSCC